MSKRNIFFSSLIVFLLFAFLVGAVQADSPLFQVEEEASSAVAPAGYSPTLIKSDIRTQADADILLIQTALPWNSDADMQVLNSLGYAYDIVDMSSIDSVDLFSYPVILIVNDQVQAFYDQYAAQVADFEAYVTAGGVLVFFAASDGWARGTLNANLPGGVEVVTPHYEYYNYITNADHPIVTALLSDGIPLVDSDLYSTYCSHGYFQSLPADTIEILEEQNGYPTLVEYPLGSGKVIASTQTWEYSHDRNRDFAVKALDDVFLYTFSGGATPTDDIQLDLRVEDAPDSVTVDKSPGSYVDIVARVSGGKAYMPTVTLQIPSDMFGLPTTAFTRDLPNNEGVQSVQYENLGNGNYQINATLKVLDAYQSDFYKEIVWRFQIPESATPQNNIELDATVAVSGLAIAHPTDQVKLDIINWGTSIVVTNRQLLFDEYGDNGNWRDVSLLLEEVYKSLDFWWGEVFYVDHYDIDWNQGTDENAANTVADDIDDLLETWYVQLTEERDGVSLEPMFLVVAGGDETIPFYRMDDDDYEALGCWLWFTTCEEDIGPNNTQDPVLNAYEDNYFLSDNVYADVGGGKSDWEKGNLELAIGRIVGATANDMRTFLVDGYLKTEPLTGTVLMSIDGSQTPKMESALNAKNVTIWGLNDPDMVDNNDWTRQQFLNAWQKDYQIFYYGGHGSYDAFPGTDDWEWWERIEMPQLPQGHIAENHPLLVADACNLGVPTPQSGARTSADSVMYKLANLGMAGMVVSTGLSSFDAGGGTAYGEEFVNSYIANLIDGGQYSNWFGQAFLDAKKNYNHGWLWDKSDKKTMLEYVYYGLPWSFMETPYNPAATELTALEAPSYDTSFAVPQAIGVMANSYSKVFTTTVSTYRFTPTNGFELLEIPGADYLYTYQEPVLPYILTTLNLPPSATVSDIQLISQQSTALGQHNIPAADPATQYHPTTGYTSTMSVSGDYPPTGYAYEVSNYSDRTEVRIAVAPAIFNVETQDVTLHDVTVLQINYEAEEPILVHNLTFAPEYRGDEAIDATAIVENVGVAAKTLTATLNIYDGMGVLAGTLTTSPFTVGAGKAYELPMSWTGSLSHGGYNTTLAVYEGGSKLAVAPGSFSVSSGAVTAFDVPPTIKSGEYGNLSLAFTNYKNSTVNVTSDIYVYDKYGIQRAKLLQRNFDVAPNSEGTTDWWWNPGNLSSGSYTVEAVVTVDGGVYGAPTRNLTVTGSAGSESIFLPLILK